MRVHFRPQSGPCRCRSTVSSLLYSRARGTDRRPTPQLGEGAGRRHAPVPWPYDEAKVGRHWLRGAPRRPPAPERGHRDRPTGPHTERNKNMQCEHKSAAEPVCRPAVRQVHGYCGTVTSNDAQSVITFRLPKSGANAQESVHSPNRPWTDPGRMRELGSRANGPRGIPSVPCKASSARGTPCHPT